MSIQISSGPASTNKFNYVCMGTDQEGVDVAYPPDRSSHHRFRFKCLSSNEVIALDSVVVRTNRGTPNSDGIPGTFFVPTITIETRNSCRPLDARACKSWG